MSDPADLSAYLDEAWQHLGRGVADSRSPARYPTFATTASDGTPEARTVALRGANRSAGIVEVHTDVETDKVRALRDLPVAALHIWLPRANLQIRMTANVNIHTGPDVEGSWTRVPPASRVSYGTLPAPGTPISDVYDYEKPPERARFAVLQCHLCKIYLVHLDTRHRRAIFKKDDDWKGAWVAP